MVTYQRLRWLSDGSVAMRPGHTSRPLGGIAASSGAASGSQSRVGSVTGSAPGTYAFEDNFAGASLDLSKWVRESQTNGYGSLDTFRADADLSVVSGGTLKVTAIKDLGAVPRPWRAAFLSTRGKFVMKTGTVEFRAKLPTEQGAFSAIWADNGIHGENTRYGEIDFMELFPGGGSKGPGSYLTLIDWYNNTGGGTRGTNIVMSAAEPTGGWHTWKITWDASGFTTWFDGSPSGGITAVQFNALGSGADYQQSFVDPDRYLVLNQAVGTSWGGLEPLPGVTRMEIEIDWIRVTKVT